VGEGVSGEVSEAREGEGGGMGGMGRGGVRGDVGRKEWKAEGRWWWGGGGVGCTKWGLGVWRMGREARVVRLRKLGRGRGGAY